MIAPGKMPREKTLEAALGLMRDGYEFIGKRARELGSDVIATRLLLQPTICLTGEAAARLFYDPTRFRRTKAAPVRVKLTLFGRGALQGTDGLVHRRRKQTMLGLLTPDHVTRLAGIMEQHCLAARPKWVAQRRVGLFTGMREIILRSVCAWAGVPLPEADVSRRADQIAAVIDGAGAFGVRYWRARAARKECDVWMASVITAARTGKLNPVPGTGLHAMVNFRDPDGARLDARTAGVELFNLVRPTVAVDRFITFAALALHNYPVAAEQLRSGAIEAGHFVQEVRRFYPFFPFVVARVKSNFVWRGFRFRQGRRALLDIYGTDHDPRVWSEPNEFRPERFRKWNGGAFNFIPQGGGDAAAGHRCPGERVTVELMKVALRFLTTQIEYQVPPQDLTVDLRRMPAIPKSEFIITRIRIPAPVTAIVEPRESQHLLRRSVAR